MFEEWVEFLDMYEFYIGIYILIATSVFVMAVAFIGCGAALMENILALYIVRMFIVDFSDNSRRESFLNKLVVKII